MAGESRGVVLLERWGRFAERDDVPELAGIYVEDVVYRDVPMHRERHGTFRGREHDTGREYEVSGVSVARLRGGKIVEQWDAYDDASFVRQIGRLDEFVAMVRDPAW
ncbi:MAG TPA: ester cyclase [Kutzneria sp.]|nr:ester cyclase [Kutzneria sp.]